MTAENGWKVLSSFHIFHQWYSCQRLYWIHLLPLMVLKIVYTFIHVCHLSVYVWLYFFLDCIICLNSLFHSVWWQSIASEQFGMNWKHSFAFPTLAHTSPWTTAGPVRLQWSESTHTHTRTQVHLWKEYVWRTSHRSESVLEEACLCDWVWWS